MKFRKYILLPGIFLFLFNSVNAAEKYPGESGLKSNSPKKILAALEIVSKNKTKEALADIQSHFRNTNKKIWTEAYITCAKIDFSNCVDGYYNSLFYPYGYSKSDRKEKILLPWISGSDYIKKAIAILYFTQRGADSEIGNKYRTLLQKIVQSSIISKEKELIEASLRAIGEYEFDFTPKEILPFCKADYSLTVKGLAAVILGNLRAAEGIECIAKLVYEKDVTVKIQAIKALGKIGSPDGLTHIFIALKDKDQNVCDAAIQAAVWIGDARAVLPLIEKLSDTFPVIRESAAEALGGFRDARAVPKLIDLMKSDPEPSVRVASIKALGEIGDSQVLGPAIYTLAHGTSAEKIQSAVLLGNLGYDQATGALIEALKDQDIDVRNQAANSLGKIGSKRACTPLLEIFQNTKYTYDSANLIANSGFAIGKIECDNGLPILKKKFAEMNKENWLVGASLSAGILIYEPDSKDKVYLNFLSNALQKNKSDKIFKVWYELIKKKSHRSFTPILIKSISVHEGSQNFWAFLWMFYQIGDPSAYPSIKKYFNHRNMDIRKWAIYALGSFAGSANNSKLSENDRKEAIEFLKKLNKSERIPVVRAAVSWAMEQYNVRE